MTYTYYVILVYIYAGYCLVQRIRLRSSIGNILEIHTSITTTCSLLHIRLLVQHVVYTHTEEMAQRGNVVIERNESHLLLSPIGTCIITNRPFNCDGRTDGHTTA